MSCAILSQSFSLLNVTSSQSVGPYNHKMDGWTEGARDRWMDDGWLDGQMDDGWRNGWMDGGWLDGWTDG